MVEETKIEMKEKENFTRGNEHCIVMVLNSYDFF